MNLRICQPWVVSFSLLLTAPLSVAFADAANDEAHFISVLQSQAPPQEKDLACVWLKRHGTAQSVPALAALLSDEGLSQSARYALESMPGSAAENALIAALAHTSGAQKAGVIHSLGIRRAAGAIPELAKLLTDADDVIARVSASSLGDIGTPDALTALEGNLGESNAARQSAVVDGCFRCGQHFLAAGDSKRALAVYQEIYQRPTQEFLHVAAYRGMVLASGEQGVKLIAQAVADGPAPLQMEAIQLVHEKEIPGLTQAIANLLPKADPLVQVALIEALSQRDDPAAVPAITTLAKEAKPEVRVAAVTSLGTLGSDHDLALLIGLAATAGDPAQAAARHALGLVHRGNPNQALLDLLADAKPEAQMEVIRALSSRSVAAATPQLLQLAQQADDSVRDAAFQALSHLLDPSQLGSLVQMVAHMKTDAGRAAAAQALVAACRHLQRQHDNVDLTPVWVALKNDPPETRVALLPVCSSQTDPNAQAVLRASVADRDPRIHAAAIRALCDTMDAALVPDITRLAADPSEAGFRTITIEAFVRLTTQEAGISLPEAARIQMFQTVAPVAQSPAEKRVVLSGLAAIADERTLQLAQPFLSDGTVSNEAARAVIAICRHLPDAEAARTALEKFISDAPGHPLKPEAEAALKMVAGRANYLTTWQFTGPYRQKGQDYHALFDIVFPPEKSDAPGVDWRSLPLGDDPDAPWAMDLLKMMGGEQEVAYARTSIHSPGAQPGWLLVNSDDGVKVWLNGEVVFAHNVSRSVRGEPDKVKITLQPGWNDLRLKVTQNNQGWGFGVRLTDSEGAQIKSVQYAASPAHNQLQR